MRALVTSALELLGMGLIVAGIALFSPVLGVIAAGIALIFIGQALA
jgi:hypothetical protein